MNKKYKAIFFDWDGTAVTSRTAPVEDAVVAMKPLLQQGTKLVIVSGTTYDKIAGGKFHTYFTEEEQKNLFFGLGRGAYNYLKTAWYRIWIEGTDRHCRADRRGIRTESIGNLRCKISGSWNFLQER